MKRICFLSLLITALLAVCSSCGNSETADSAGSTVNGTSNYESQPLQSPINPETVTYADGYYNSAQPYGILEKDDIKSEEYGETAVEFSEQIIITDISSDNEKRSADSDKKIVVSQIDFPPVENSQASDIKDIALQTESVQEEMEVLIVPIHDKPMVINNTYSYKKLPEESKVIYNKVLSSIKSHTETIEFSNPIELQTLMDIYSLIYSDEINMQYIGNSFKYDTNPVSSMKISYKYSADVMNAITAQTESAAEAILSQITPDMTEYDIIKLFHDRIIENCVYNASEEFSNMAYGALVKGKAACQGYAHAMSYLCNKVGIENTFASGFVGEPHVWNMINLGGSWYNIDLTGDDVETGIPDFISYNFFNVKDEELSDRQYYDGITERPQAISDEYNFFVYNGFLVSSKEAATQVIYNQFIDCLNSGRKFIYIKCSDKETYDTVYDYLFTEHNIFAIQLLAEENTEVQLDESTLQLVKNDALHTFQIIL